MQELIQVADAVAREKNIDREIVVSAMEEAIQKAGCSKYGYDHDIRAQIDRSTGEISLFRYRNVVEEFNPETPELETQQILLKQAKKIKSDVQLGEHIIDKLPPLDFGRIAAQTAKQVIFQKVRDAERERQFEEYKDRIGEIVSGTVKRVEYGNVTVDLGRGEAFLRRNDALPREHFKNGERVRAYIYDVRQEARGPQVFLSRTHADFLAKLFRQEVPEIYDGIIEIKAVARDPGSRAKIAVISNDSSIDPVGACVGMRGSRVQAVVGELQGEKIDIIPWTQDTATFVVNALAPAEVTKVVMDEDSRRLDVVVPDDQLSLAIGRRGQNVRLATQLSGWNIDIMTEAEESERRQTELKTCSALFIEAMDVDEVIAHLLVVEGFSSIEDIVETSNEELGRIEGFDIDVATELKNRAASFLKIKKVAFEKRAAEIGISKELADVKGLTQDMILSLGEKNIKKMDDLGDLASDELRELVGDDKLSESQANEIIMAARASWFQDDDKIDDNNTIVSNG
ncbi:MAG: transcription termination/antitermination protein NusA [Alphaproteobacteria bacterium]|nr:transcription termination/antitermination protein NusA [Alphaproteobacteria bacterium]MCK5518518.1 transcription termination/antitermination protein NusA [Alphaproteobacteria bacterium]MCK5658564.1 transcription termination/antitermination protein NusA [Alphaproteobacteria bacterium]